uniref:Replication factor C subunit 4 n=2 Tax=Cyprinus carpio TaxID=7962 RepID=A0A9J8D8N8_CYPCA
MQAFLKGSQSVKAQKPSSSSSAGEKKQKAVPWVEKYRPKCVDEVAFQEEVVAVLKKSLEGADLPNLLFYGPPGTGKTSTILAAARELYGPELYRQRVLELNASDERGIQVIREKVKSFAQLTAAGARPDGKPCPPFKIIILDEADSMTGAAQAALRRTMEKESRTTRFCLICNYVSRIIEPLTSRCSKFRFKPLANHIQQERLLQICGKENLKYTTEVHGQLHLFHPLQFFILILLFVVPPKVIEALLQICCRGTFEKLELAVKDMIDQGYAATNVLNQLHDVIIDEKLSDKQKSVITEKMAEVDKCLSDGADEYLQLLSLCSVIMQQATHST